MRVMCVTGARPNFMKVKPVADALEALGVEVVLVHTGQHYDASMSDVFFDELGIRHPDHLLGVGSGSHAGQTAAVMTAFEPLVAAERPDVVVVVGDVNSTLAAAVVAAKAGPLVAYVEAGLRSRDWAMPEEVNRVVTDRVSDLLLASSPDAVDNLVAEEVTGHAPPVAIARQGPTEEGSAVCSDAVTVDEPRVSTARSSPPAIMAFLLGKLPPGPILNLGAGEGVRFDEMFVVNVDHVAPRADASRPFVVADAGRLPFRAGAFTGALLKDVIEHVVDPISVLSEVRTVAEPTCEIVVTVPRAIARAVWDDPTHIRGFTAGALMQALELAGWRAVRAPARIGGVPGAGRLGLVPYLESLLRVPVFGHWFGTNWLVQAQTAWPAHVCPNRGG